MRHFVRQVMGVGQVIQLWLPLFDMSIFRGDYARDLERAQKEWRGEAAVWLLPDVEKPQRWHPDYGGWRLWELAIPSETINRIQVVHITQEGYCYPPYGLGLPEAWKGIVPKPLFRQWLNGGFPSFCLGPKALKINRPVFCGDEVRYEERVLRLEPGPVMPITSVDETSRKVTLRWPPPESGMPPPISPETESLETLGPVEWEGPPLVEGLPTAKDRLGHRSVNVWVRWPAPFDEMFPTGGGMDLLYHHAHMRRCLEDLAEENTRLDARQKIAAWAGRFAIPGWSNLELAYILPNLVARGSEALLTDIEGRYDIWAEDLGQLFRHPDYSRLFQQGRVEVLRVFGWLGYFWQELNQAVNAGEYIPVCKKCGRILSGTRAKKNCGPEDNLECYRSRRAEEKRKERERQKLKAFLKNSPA